MKRNLTLIIAVLLAVLIAGIFIGYVWRLFTSVSSSMDRVEVAELVMPIVEAETEVTAEPLPEPLEAASEPATAPQAAPAHVAAPAESAPVAIPYAAEMTSVGIAEADHATVARMLLDGDQFKPPVNSNGLARASREYLPIDKLDTANRYVLAAYGSWDAAWERSFSTGGMW